MCTTKGLLEPPVCSRIFWKELGGKVEMKEPFSSSFLPSFLFLPPCCIVALYICPGKDRILRSHAVTTPDRRVISLFLLGMCF